VRIGLDLGGTKIEGVVLSGEGEVVRTQRIATPQGDYDAMLAAVAGLVHALEGSLAMPVGIGAPGAFSLKTGFLKNSTCLNGRPFKADLSRLLDREIRMANDADCFALSEASDGAAAGSVSVFGAILGTGVGGGVCYHGELISGVNAIAGEWGHNPLPLGAYRAHADQTLPDPRAGERVCYCGRSDCVETWLAGPSLARSYLAAGGRDRLPRDIVTAAQAGEVVAEQILRQYSNLLALALGTVINIVDPESIVIGGGMSNVARIYNELPAFLPAYVFSDEVHTRVMPAKYGDSSGVRGAAWLWPHDAA
jgi:fructokinase